MDGEREGSIAALTCPKTDPDPILGAVGRSSGDASCAKVRALIACFLGDFL
jgi:hypothetical protein